MVTTNISKRSKSYVKISTLTGTKFVEQHGNAFHYYHRLQVIITEQRYDRVRPDRVRPLDQKELVEDHCCSYRETAEKFNESLENCFY